MNHFLKESRGIEMQHFRTRRHRRLATRFICLVTGLAWIASAAQARKLDPAEIQALSPLCRAVLTDDRPRRERLADFQSTLPGSCGVHHTCYGELAMIKYNREALKKPSSSDRGAMARYERRRKGILQNAVSEFSYELRCAPPTYPLLPMIYTERGKALSLQGKHSAALSDFMRALELDPNYAPARQALALARIRAGVPKSSQ